MRVRPEKVRSFITPEGVNLELEIASAGSRFAALVVDLLIMLVALALFTWLIVTILPNDNRTMQGALASIWMLGFFLLRNCYFMAFELGPRAATLGKRLLKMRVVARDGGRLTADAVIARNLVREMEIMLPLVFMGFGSAQGQMSGFAILFGFGWTLVLSLFLLFNKDRMRMGDLIAGTWVVNANRTRLANSLVDAAAAPEIKFSAEELGVYGIYELQELERILRVGDPKVVGSVADTVRAKINRWDGGDDATFLNAYYGQLKGRLERDVLFGKRRENKFQDSHGREIAAPGQ
jgi:uncharacterized RDD family membrane protein YckC